MESKLSKKKSIFLLFNYLVGYLFVYPLIISILIKIGFNAILIEDLFYILFFITFIFLAKDVLIDSFNKFKEDYNGIIFRSLIRYLKMFLIMMVVNLFLSMFLKSESENQLAVLEMLKNRTIITIFLSCIFAPIIEELVFREIIFKECYHKWNLNIAIVISGVSFGLIHVMSSLLTGNFNDLLYIISYGLMGMIICKAYKNENNFIGSFMLHFLNNSFAIILNLILMSI